jgi:UDP-N-acetyl-D-glucosamine/UDP-N-acetyl-D-galactosamine dehydrogenase
MKVSDTKIGILGLGYVGLPLAIEFGKKFDVKGLDLKESRINELKDGFDSTLEIESSEFKESKNLVFTSSISDLKDCNVYIVTVPTPLNDYNQPDLNPLKSASEMIGKILKNDDIVIYESTVYPGATEEFCVPILERNSGLKFNINFFAGYSPERINPGDKTHRLPSILKVTSGSNLQTANFVDLMYKEIITAGTYQAESIKVAEASKVIENTQRDINIALMNELSIIFEKLDIDTSAVLEAAGTKWNFLKFTPGLVGGHCIGVDPYYLTHKAQEVGYQPEVILSGRKMNDSMSEHIVSMLIKAMKVNKKTISGSKILILGLTFKENCPDIRNTKVVDIYKLLNQYNVHVDVYDPWVEKGTALKEYGINLIDEPIENLYDGVMLAVSHNHFIELGVEQIKSYGNEGSIFYDIKSVFSKKDSDLRL